MGRFMPGARISQAHGMTAPADPETGARRATVYALYHPAAALRSSEVERQSYADVAGIPAALLEARAMRADPATTGQGPAPEPPAMAAVVATLDDSGGPATDPMTFF